MVEGQFMCTWITEKNNRVGRICQTHDDVPPGPEWIKVPNDWNGNPEDKLDWFGADMRRIPDRELVAAGKRTDNTGRWYNKTNVGESKYIHGLDEAAGEDWTREKPLANEPYQKWDGASGAWAVDTEKKEIADLENRMGALKSEISSRDWKVIKAQRLGRPVDDLYPGETAWYSQTVEKINGLEAQLEELKR
jgi:hypothetical protein